MGCVSDILYGWPGIVISPAGVGMRSKKARSARCSSVIKSATLGTNANGSRVVSVEKEKVPSAVVWTTTYYQSFSTYYVGGWQTATPIGPGREITTIAVETLLFDIKGGLFWGSVTESTNPKNVQTYVKGLAAQIAKELQREGLVKPRK